MSVFRRNVIKALTATKWTTGYEGNLSKNMVPIDAGENWLKQTYTFENGQVCTGLLMGLIDSATTSLAICSGPQMAGITMDMSISNFVPIDPINTPKIILYSKMESMEEKFCHISCKVLCPNEKILFASGRQTKFYHPKSRQPLRHVDLHAENLVL